MPRVKKTDSSALVGMTGVNGGTDSSALVGMTRDSHGLRPRNDRGSTDSLTSLGMTDTWEIRKGGKVWVSSTAENCGYLEPALESLRKAGYSLYKNGTCVMKGARR